VTYYGDCKKFAKTPPWTLTTKELAVASRQRTVPNFLFHQWIFGQTQYHYRLPTNPTYLFPRLEIKLIGRHFDTAEVIQAESQTVLNTLQNKTSRTHLQNGRAGNGAYTRKGTTSRWWWPVDPKLFLTTWQHQYRKLWMVLCTFFFNFPLHLQSVPVHSANVVKSCRRVLTSILLYLIGSESSCDLGRQTKP
jgi:hypothetical protein